MKAMAILEERPIEKTSLEAFLKERGILAYARAGLALVLVNGRSVRPSELAAIEVSKEDLVVVVPLARGG